MLLCVTRCNNMSVKCPKQNFISLQPKYWTTLRYNILCNKLYCKHISTFLLRLCCDTSAFKRKHPISKLQRPHSAPQSLTNRICRRQDYLFTIIQNVFRCSRTRICWIVQQLLKLNCLQVRRTLPHEWLVLSGCSDPLTSSVSGGHFIISLLLLWSDR